MAKRPQDFKRFLENWDAIWKAINELIPEDGQQINDIHFERLAISSK